MADTCGLQGASCGHGVSLAHRGCPQAESSPALQTLKLPGAGASSSESQLLTQPSVLLSQSFLTAEAT